MAKGRFRFPLTALASALGLLVIIAARLGSINLIELPLGVLAGIEQNEMDDLITLMLLVAAAFAMDHVRTHRQAKAQASLDAERLRVMKATVRTVQDIVNNCLNELQLLRLEAEGHVPPDCVNSFDQAIQEASTRLNALGDADNYMEKAMASGVGVDAGNAR